MLAYLRERALEMTGSALLVGGRGVEGVEDGDAGFHDELDLAKKGDVGEGVALDGDEVGEFAGFDGADAILPGEEFGGGGGGGADGFKRGQAALGERDQFFGIFALVVYAACVVAAGDFYAEGFGCLHLVVSPVQKVIVAFAPIAGELRRAPGIGGVNDADGRHKKDTFFLHEFDVFAVGGMAVFDGVHAGGEGVEDAFGRGGVSGDFAVELVGFFDDDAHLFDGKSWSCPVGIDLDEIGAVADLFANGAASILCTANHLGTGGEIAQIGRNAEGIVLADGGDGARGDLHARAFDKSLIDGVAQSHVGIGGAFVLDVANGGKAGVQGDARVGGTFESAESLGFCGEVENVGVGSTGHAGHQVSVAINQTGKKSGAGEINDFGGFWGVGMDLRGGADLLDAVAFDEDGSVFEVVAGTDVEDARGFDDCDIGGLRFRVRLGK